MFGMNPKAIFKTLRTLGLTVKFDLDRKALVISDDDGTEQVHNFDDIEKMVNGEG